LEDKSFAWRPYLHDATRNEAMRYTHWHPEQPDNQFGTEDCVVIWYFPKMKVINLGKWNDEPCSDKRCFICEIDA